MTDNALVIQHQNMIMEQTRVREFLKTHKIAISFSWRGNEYGYFGSHAEADAEWVRVLRAEGYVPRKWWQISRWGEKAPPKDIVAALRGEEGEKA